MHAASGKPARAVRKHGPTRLDVNHHRGNRVDEREGVRPPVLARPNVRSDGRHVRRELYEERTLRRRAHGRDNLAQHLRILPEGVSARLDVGTAHVHLDRVHRIAHPRGDLCVLLNRATPDVGDHGDVRHLLPVPRHGVLEEMLHARPLQANGVHEPTRHLRVARHLVAGPGVESNALRRHRAEL